MKKFILKFLKWTSISCFVVLAIYLAGYSYNSHHRVATLLAEADIEHHEQMVHDDYQARMLKKQLDQQHAWNYVSALGPTYAATIKIGYGPEVIVKAIQMHNTELGEHYQ